jgi:hypothetical protein
MIPALRPNDPPGAASVLDNTLVGQTEPQIRKAYGMPAGDLSVYHALALQPPPKPLTSPTRTLIFHTKTGTFWVWLEQQGNDWMCFESCWVKDGVEF